MRLSERDTAANKPSHVWRLGLRMPTKALDVVIQVIANDQNDIRLLSRNLTPTRRGYGDYQAAVAQIPEDPQFHG